MTESKHPTTEHRADEASPCHAEGRDSKKPILESPKVITYSGDNILEELGPAHACSPFSGSVVSC